MNMRRPFTLFRSAQGRRGDEFAFTMAAGMLILGFLIGGGARDDLLSLILWRPLTALCVFVALAYFGKLAWLRGKPLLLPAAAVITLVFAHLVPLPPSIWAALPGREPLSMAFQAARMPIPWEPLSIVEARSWNVLFALGGPVAILLASLILSDRSNRRLLHVIIGIGFFSGIFGLFQALGSPEGPLYLYRITNRGASVGLFANRNHQAAMLATLLPLLAANLTMFKGKPDKLAFQRWVTLAMGTLLVPLILMTGSRTGIVLAIVATLLSCWVFKKPEAEGRVVGVRSDQRVRLVGAALTSILALAAIAVALRSSALQRLLETDSSTELRVAAMPTVLHAIWSFFPIGSGFGTFVEAYQIFEPDALISQRYFNHAHNDLLELLLTTGLPGALVLCWVGGLALWALPALLRTRALRPKDSSFQTGVLGRAGFGVLMILAVASLTDYPLRVPSLALYAMVASVWVLNAYKVRRQNGVK